LVTSLFTCQALMRNATDAMKESRVQDFLVLVLEYFSHLNLFYI